MAIFRAVTTGSEEPLMTLPIADRQLAIDRFRTLMSRAPASWSRSQNASTTLADFEVVGIPKSLFL
jgi:hypothetical protein